VPERGKKLFNIFHGEAVEIFFSGSDMQKILKDRVYFFN
jgi:hypothetical protein